MRSRLRNGELRPGDRLPSERELVEHFEVSRNTVREAVRMLEVAGLVEVKRGASGGVFVADGNTSSLTQTMSDMFSLASFSLDDLLEVRLWIGAIVARVVCERGTEADFDRLQQNIDEARMLSAKGDWSARSEKNHEFQNLLAAACHNPIILIIQQSITEVIREIVSAVGTMRDDRLINSKSTLLKLLRARDADKAMAQMEAHITMVNDFWQEALVEWSGKQGIWPVSE